MLTTLRLHTCSALARAGKSVLVLDAADSYGASWSSLSGQDHVHCLVNRHLEQQQLQGQQDQSETGAAGASQIDQGQAAQPADAQRTANADSTLSHVQQSPTTVELKTVQPYGSLHGSVALYTHPEVDAALANKQLIIDLAPKVGCYPATTAQGVSLLPSVPHIGGRISQ